MTEPPAIKIDFSLKIDARSTKSKRIPYKGRLTDSLADLREKAKYPESNDRFANPDGTEALEVDEEELYTIEEITGLDPDDEKKKGKPIEIWTAAYIQSKKPAPALPPRPEVNLHIVRKPQGLGGQDKTFKVKRTELETMTLEKLRSELLKRGYILKDDQFVDQGVPKSQDVEADLKVNELLPAESDKPEDRLTLQVFSKAHAEKSLQNTQWQDYKPEIKANDFKVDLETPDLDLSKYTFAPDQTEGQTGFGSIAVPVEKNMAKTLSQLSEKQQLDLLNACRLYPKQGDLATCPALRMDEQIEFCATNIILCKSVTLQESNTTREDMVSFTYSEEISKWQTYLVTESKLGTSVPETVELGAGGGSSQSKQEFAKGVRVYLNKVLALPKAEVVLDGVSLSPVFVNAVKKAVDRQDGYELMRVLHRYGHFVATHFVIGGKVVCTSSKVLKENCKREKLGWSFNAQADGAFTAQGVPVKLGGGSGVKSGQESDDTEIDQHYELRVRTTGGFGEGSSSQTDKLGDNWLTTVATQPQTWRVIGYKDDTLHLTLDYLEPDLQEKAKELLKKYFESQLVLKKSNPMGGDGGDDWQERKFVKLNSRIAAYSIMFDQNIDSIRFSYEDPATNQPIEGDWHGRSRENQENFAIEKDDEIVGIQVGWDKTVDHVVFYTKKGGNLGNVFGRAKGAVKTHTFSEPRIRGFHGRAGHFLDALGVYYYDLSNDLNGIHKSALQSLEPHLYPVKIVSPQD